MGTLILLFILPIGIYFFLKNAVDLPDSIDDADTLPKADLTSKEDAPEDKEKQAALQAQREWVEYYANSAVIQEILEYLCDGDMQRNLPYEIRISDEAIRAKGAGWSKEYNFMTNRLPCLTPVIETGTDDYEQYLVRPQVAMAEAINCLMENQYSIADKADRILNQHGSDDDLYFSTTYRSNYVLMTLIPTRNF